MDTTAQLEAHFGRPLDKHERLVAEALVSVGVLLNPSTQDFEIVSSGPVPAHVQDDYRRRGLQFAGTLAVMPGFKPGIALDMPLTDATISAIMSEFLALVERAMTQVEKNSGSVSWLHKLWTLPDTRKLPN